MSAQAASEPQQSQPSSGAGQTRAANSLTSHITALKEIIGANPTVVTPEILKMAHDLLGKMVEATGHPGAPHPELEIELQEEYAKVQAMIRDGTLTKEEVNHLHSLETRAHGSVEKGGITAHAQSIVDRTRRPSQGGNANRGDPDVEAQLKEEIAKVEPKIEEGTVTREEADRLRSLDTRAHGYTEKGSVVAQAQSVAAKTEQLEKQHAKVDPKVEAGDVTKEEADRLHRLENRVHGQTEKGSITAKAQSIADNKENESSQTNVSSTNDKPNDTAQSADSPADNKTEKASTTGVADNKENKSTQTKTSSTDDKTDDTTKSADSSVDNKTEKGSSTTKVESVVDNKENESSQTNASSTNDKADNTIKSADSPADNKTEVTSAVKDTVEEGKKTVTDTVEGGRKTVLGFLASKISNTGEKNSADGKAADVATSVSDSADKKEGVVAA